MGASRAVSLVDGRRTGLKLLPPDRLVITGPVDKARWNYDSWLSWLQRRRFKLVIGLLGRIRYGTALEVGYGSGVFMPELSQRCDRLLGIDIHHHVAPVTQALAAEGVRAELHVASAESMPMIPDACVDLAVSVSTLEYVPDKVLAARELRRVLRPGGALVLVQPIANPILDAGLRLMTGESAKQYGSGRVALLPALQTEFTVERAAYFPPLCAPPLGVYSAYRLTAKSAGR
jgi:ubiquinone/menaquinone biosynthesis C-methylase UbiE